MADMSDEIYSQPGNKAHSRVWMFSFKKVNDEPPTKENLLNTTFLWQKMLNSKLKYRWSSNKSVNCILLTIFFFYIFLALNYKI